MLPLVLDMTSVISIQKCSFILGVNPSVVPVQVHSFPLNWTLRGNIGSFQPQQRFFNVPLISALKFTQRSIQQRFGSL